MPLGGLALGVLGKGSQSHRQAKQKGAWRSTAGRRRAVLSGARTSRPLARGDGDCSVGWSGERGAVFASPRGRSCVKGRLAPTGRNKTQPGGS